MTSFTFHILFFLTQKLGFQFQKGGKLETRINKIKILPQGQHN